MNPSSDTTPALWPLAMHDGYGPLLRAFFARYFEPIRFAPEAASRIRDIAERGPVVYLGRAANPIQFLYLNYLCLKHRLPLAAFVNEIDTILFEPVPLLMRHMRAMAREDGRETPEHHAQPDAAQLANVLLSGRSAMVFLQRPSTLTSVGAEDGTRLLETLIEVQRRLAHPIHVVPHMFVWDRHPEREARSLTDAVFGQPKAPGLLRSLWVLWRRYRNAFFKMAEPIDLRAFLAEGPPSDPSREASRLHEALNRCFAREFYEFTGPRLRPHREFIRDVLADPHLQASIESLSGGDHGRREALQQRASDLIDEIAAEPRIRWPLALDSVLNLFWKRMYEGVVLDEDGFERIRAALRKAPVVFCPAHRSHVDYLILSQMCLKEALPLPHIAAGINLSFWPMGPIFRHSGAFFMRRSFKGDDLYPALFRTYLRHVMREGFPIEFFIEGTRSRTGKLLPPKFGILSWLVQACLDESDADIQFVPLSIDYEKIVEARSYIKELSGGEKEKENAVALLKAGKALRSRYGKIYLQVGEILSLREYLSQRGISGSPDEESRRQLIASLGHDILFRINQVATVTPSALLAFSLLTHRRRGMTEKKLLERSRWAADWIGRRPAARFSQTLSDFPRALAEAASRFSRDGLITTQDTGVEVVFSPVESRRLALDYYRNNVVHHFVPAAIVMTGLRSFSVEAVPRAALAERIQDLSAIFKHEFLFRSRRDFDSELTAALADLSRLGLLRDEGEFVVRDRAESELGQVLCSVLEHFLESYRLCARGLALLDDQPLPEREFQNRLLRQGEHEYAQGELRFIEALSRDLFKNAVQWLAELGMVASEPGGRKGPRLLLTPAGKDPAQRESLLRRIERFLPRS